MAEPQKVAFRREECPHCHFVWWCHPSRVVLKCAVCGGALSPAQAERGQAVHAVANLVFQFATALMDDCTYSDPGDCWEMARHHCTELLLALSDTDPIKVTPP